MLPPFSGPAVRSVRLKLSTLGTVSQVGEKLSKGRDMELVNARDRVTEGIRIYVRQQIPPFPQAVGIGAVIREWMLRKGCVVDAFVLLKAQAQAQAKRLNLVGRRGNYTKLLATTCG